MWRRTFIGASIAALSAGLGAILGRPARPLSARALRPPGALAEEKFLSACVRCLRCVNVCPNGCLKVHDMNAGLELALTPYLIARERGCILCGECAKVCPTTALTPFGAERHDWLVQVDMGVARVNKALCFSYHGRTCGACYQACPLAGEAMKIGVFEQPIMQPQNCVGCGLCEQACLHLPQAIRVVANRVGNRKLPTAQKGGPA